MKKLLNKLYTDRSFGRILFYCIVALGLLILSVSLIYLRLYEAYGMYDFLRNSREYFHSAFGIFSLGFGFDFIMSELFERKGKET